MLPYFSQDCQITSSFLKPVATVSSPPTNDSLKTTIILNPASAGGRTGQRLSQIVRQIERFLGKAYRFVVTQRPLEAETLARQAILKGCELIVAVGGDGTIQEVVNGFFLDGEIINACCHLGIVSSGTGQGLARSLNLPSGIKKQLEIIFSGQSAPLDVGRIRFHDQHVQPTVHFFVNEFQAGIGGRVVQQVQGRQKRLGGFLAFGQAALYAALHHRAQPIDLVIDGDLKISGSLVGLVIANGAFTGGGMNLTPEAKLNDGLLDILLIHEQSPVQRIVNFPKIYSGRHIFSKNFSNYQARKIHISSDEEVMLAADGELFGALPCSVEILPAAINVRSAIKKEPES